MSAAINLGYFASLAALSAAFPASSVNPGTQAYAPGLAISNGTKWVIAVDPISVTYFGAV